MNRYRVVISTNGKEVDVVVDAEDEVEAQSKALNSVRNIPSVVGVYFMGEITQGYGDEHLGG